VLIETLITDLSRDPFNPELNFEIAQEYERIGQTASAISFYLRTAEYGYESRPSYAYASLLKASICFESQQNRQATVENLIYKAIAYLPYRQEAYFFLSRFYERSAKWQESYTWACAGLHLNKMPELPADLGFNDYCLQFEKAVSAWWVGRKDESVEIFTDLLTKDLSPEYRTAIEGNLARIQ